MTILVTGASGTVGSAVCRVARARGLPVRAAVRPQRAADDPAAVAFDFLDASTWTAAFAGIEIMFLVRPPALSRVERDILPALAAARGAGVRHVVFLSVQGAEANPVVPHAKIEKWLRAAGMSWTFLRPSYFMQNLMTTHVAEIRDHSAIDVPAGNGRTAFVDVDDIAAVAGEVLANPHQHVARAWTPTGPRAATYDEVAEILSRELGRRIRYRRPGWWRYARHARRDLQMPWAMVAVTAAIYTVARIGRAAALTDDVRTVTGRAPATLETFVHRERSVWRPSR